MPNKCLITNCAAEPRHLHHLYGSVDICFTHYHRTPMPALDAAMAYLVRGDAAAAVALLNEAVRVAEAKVQA